MGASAPPVECPLVLVGRDGRRRVVQAADRAAADAGLSVGMPATKAQALLHDLIIKEADPDADREALDRLALWALRRYAPIVAADPPNGLVIDTTGAAHLHGGEAIMIADMVARLTAAGMTARAAVADSWGAAHALAHYVAKPTIMSAAGKDANAILPLPVGALRLPPDMVASVRRLGFECIADLAGRPRAPLALRFGPELGRRLDQAFGRLAEPIEPLRPAELIQVQRTFADPIGAAETIARYIGKLVTQLCAALEGTGVGARRLDLLCHRVDARLEAVRVGTAQPIRDAARLTRLLCDRIEMIDPGFGIEKLSLIACIVEPLVPTQRVSSLAEAPQADVSDLIDTLANRVGENRIYRTAPVASDVPERCVRRIAPIGSDTERSWPAAWPRPSRLLGRPEPIDTVALLPDHPPVTFTWRGIRRRVRCADGPERIFGEWWKCDAELATVRDYFRVEDETGERFWIYRAGDGEDSATGSQRWFLHGIFG